MEIVFKINTDNLEDIKCVIDFCEKFINEKEVKKDNEKKPKYTLEEIRMELVDLSKRKDKVFVKNILNSFGVDKLSDVKESDYEKLKQKIDEVLNAPC